MSHATPAAVGIDFGTTNSSAAIYDGAQVRLLPIDPSSASPEVVKTILYITRDDAQYIGEEAVQVYYQQNIGRLRRFVKKWVGEISYSGGDMFYVTDVYAYVDELLPGRLLQYLKTALRTPSYQGTLIFGKRYSAQDLTTVYLRLFKERIETLLERPVERVVLGRPVHLSKDDQADAQAQQYLLDAAHQAGFSEVELEFEPIAAALEYEARVRQPQNIVVFDFGGGTLDITLMRIGEKGTRRVFATGGVDIAGSNFDTAIIRAKLLNHFGYNTHYSADRLPFPKDLVEHIYDWQTLPTLGTLEMKEFFNQAIQTADQPCRIQNLRSLIFNEYGFVFYNQVEQAKIQLSSDYNAAIDLRGEDIAVWQMITRSQFEHIIADYRQGVQDCLLETIRASGLAIKDIDRVVTTGGSSSIPCFNQMLADLFGRDKLMTSSVFTSVTAGLAIKAYEVFHD